MTRLFLILTGLLWLGYGIYCLIMPQALAASVGVIATSATGVVELRAMYGGRQSAIGALALLAGVAAAWRKEGLVALLFAYAGVALARLMSAAIMGEFSSYVVSALAFEATSALITLALLRRDLRSIPAAV